MLSGADVAGDGAANRKRFFVRAIVRQTERIQTVGDIFDQFPGPEVSAPHSVPMN